MRFRAGAPPPLLSTALRLAVAAGLCLAGVAHAGSSNPSTLTNLLRANGEGEVIGSGDWVAEPTSPGLGNAYRFFIEVPPGLAQLVVEVFDADIGRGGNNEGARDLITSGAFNTSVQYQLFRPSGAQVGGNIVCTAANNPAVCVDNAWSALFGAVAAPEAGHWQLVVDPNNNGDETMGFGVRAHDGDASAGGTELNVYADSFLGLGPTTATQQANTVFPYVTSGCFVRESDFDVDNAAGTSFALTGSAGFAQTFTTVSGNALWQSNASTPFATDLDATNYGIWTTVADVRKAAGSLANMMTFYVASPFAAVAGSGGPPANPRAQPEAGAFRLYLPTDGGGAPTKPLVEQFVRLLTGTNPPTAGQTSRFTVTVRVTNPTARPITFSGTNTVSTTVPAGIAYAGGALTSQGTITAQPATASTAGGAVVWNPGSVGAGATALLSYNLDITPTAAGQRILVTGIGAASGTKAAFVDETGNATQARSTMSFGPLCELAITSGTLTWAAVVDVTAEHVPGAVQLHWRTAGEAGTAGFTVFRLGADDERVAVGGFIPSVMRIQGGRYGVLDENAPADGPVRYLIVERDVRGGQLESGPFTVFGAGSAGVLGPRLDLTPVAASAERSTLADVPQAVELGPRNGAEAPRADHVRVRVAGEGLVAVPLVEAAALLRVPPDVLIAAADTAGVSLRRNGLEVPYDVEAGQLLFFAPAPSGPFAAATTWSLAVGPGLRASSTFADPGTAAPTRTSAREAVRVEENLFPAPVVDLDPLEDLWFWQPFLGGDSTFGDFHAPLALDDDVRGEKSITIALQGATESGVPGEHHARILLDGVVLGDVRFTGITRHEATFVLPLDARTGAMDLEIEALAEPNVDISVFYLDSIVIEHERALTARRTQSFRATGGEVVAVASPAAPLHFYDIEGGALVRLDGTRSSDGVVRARMPADGAYVATGFLQRPLSMEPVLASSLAAGGADVIVLTSKQLRAGADALADWHRRRHITSRVVDVRDVLDAYAAGDFDPRALTRFLNDARAHWQPAPTAVVLVGDGDLDYKDVLGLHENGIPPTLLRTDSGVIAADALVVDADADGVPDLSIGRIPAHSSADVLDYIRRASAWSGPQRGLLVADAPSRGDDFSLSTAGFADELALPHERIDGGALPTERVRAKIFSGISGGADLVTYVGHGALDELSAQGFVTIDDAPELRARGSYALIALTCFINRYEIPGFSSLGEELVRRGGAVAVFAPSGLSVHAHADELGAHLFARMASGGRLGDIVRDAERSYIDAGGSARLTSSYFILGDPTLPFAAETSSPAVAPACSDAGAPGPAAGLALLFLACVHARRFSRRARA